MMYSLIKPLLFQLEPERAHAVTLVCLSRVYQMGLLSLLPMPKSEPVQLMGLNFPNRIGIAAGLDKNATCVDALAALGAGFVEIGTVTPRPQAGNPKPRVFRIPSAGALINRMGFPNDGMEVIGQRLAQRRGGYICGVNIGKNATTPLDNAVDDYLLCLHRLAGVADYIAVNVSSPNTAGLRSLQAAEQLRPMLVALLEARQQLLPTLGRPLPLLVKLAPDLSDDELSALAALLLELKVDGVIATNTTITRPQGLGAMGEQAGGLSGAPVHPLSLVAIRKLREWLGPDFPIIGVGGITSVDAAKAMRQAGADLVQVYTGLIYRGPVLLRDIARVLR
jgi:dihydroorotate dehydrogenase